MVGKLVPGQGVEPIVEVADDQGREAGRLLERGVPEQVMDLPVPLVLSESAHRLVSAYPIDVERTPQVTHHSGIEGDLTQLAARIGVRL